jgi:hypothetical protein
MTENALHFLVSMTSVRTGEKTEVRVTAKSGSVRPEFVIGSAATCGLVLSGAEVRPTHASVIRDGHRTFLSCEPNARVTIQGYELQPGVRTKINHVPFRIGDFEIEVAYD